jgi:hypothetical protein
VWQILVPPRDGEGGEIKVFTDLPDGTQREIASRCQEEFSAENKVRYSATECKRHDLYAVMLRNCARHVGKACVGGWVTGKKSTEGPFIMAEGDRESACDPCIKARRPCARIIEASDQHRLCIYPLPKSRRAGSDWSETSFWY